MAKKKKARKSSKKSKKPVKAYSKSVKKRKTATKKVIKEETEMKMIGKSVFFLGAIVALLLGLFTGLVPTVYTVTILVILGTIVGFLNIKEKETNSFLIAFIALMLAGLVNLGMVPYIGVYLRAILSNIVIFIAPAAIIIGLKHIYTEAKD